MGFEPSPLSVQGFGTPVEGANPWPTDRRQVRPPPSLVIRFDVTSTPDGERPQGVQVDGLGVKAPDLSAPINHELHADLHY